MCIVAFSGGSAPPISANRLGKPYVKATLSFDTTCSDWGGISKYDR